MRRGKNKKSSFRLSTWLLYTLLVMLEVAFMMALSALITALMHRFSRFKVVSPELTLFALVCFILGGTLTWLMGRYFFMPITEIGRAMRQVAEGNYDIQLNDRKGLKEIRTINADFNLMVKELRATEILQTDFVSNVSHEFKTPINAIEGYATLLQGAEQLSAEEQAAYVEKILFSTGRLSKLVGDILLLSKVDNQAIETNHRKFRLDEQIRQCIVLLEADWTKKDIDFDVDLENMEYTGNKGLLFHVWGNLIGNAIKFNPQGGAIRIRLLRRDGNAVFTIQDEGPGIPEEEQHHIFDKFYQSESSHKNEGNGLGLALVKQILHVSEGTISVENRPEGGCQFTVILKMT